MPAGRYDEEDCRCSPGLKKRGGAAGGDVDLNTSFSIMLSSAWEKFESCFETLKLQSSDSYTKGKVKKRGGRLAQAEEEGLQNVLYSLGFLSTSRLLAFCKQVDV